MTDPTPETAPTLIGKTIADDPKRGVISSVCCERQWTRDGEKTVWTIFADFGAGDKRGFLAKNVELSE